ncbi:MAG: ABC transporter permease subunit [Anaerolineae bacterium]|nr:ABC transporter permease subunit [Anaerolineae bacterium]
MHSVGRSFHNLWTVFRVEFTLFFVSPIVYFVGGVWLLFFGVFFLISLAAFNQGYEPTMAYMLNTMAFLVMFIVPALTMRLVAEEVRQGTHELLLTAPVRDWEVIVGKWLAVWGVMTVFILVSFVYPLFLILRGNPDLGLMASGYLVFWLWNGAVLAVGVLASSLTQYQLVAFIVGEGISLLLFLANALSSSSLIKSELVNNVLSALTLSSHQTSMLDRGLIDPVDITYFVGLMAVFLFLATQMLGTRRWRA